MGLTLEQQKAIAIVQAKRKRAAQGTPMDDLRAHAAEKGLPGFGAGAMFRSGIDAIPVLGPFLKEGVDTVQAFGDSIRTGMPFEQAKKETTFWNDAAQRGAPVESAVGTVAGTVLPLAAASVPAVGARLLGTVGNIGSRVAFGAASSAAITGADTLARGGTVEEAGKNALLGGAMGGGFPIVERFAGMVLKAVTGKALDPAEEALARAIQDDGIPLDQLQRRIDELGPEAVLADLGPNLQRQAGALASIPGAAQKTVRQALADRAAGTNSRIIADTNTTLGPAPIPSKVAGEIRTAQKALSPEYEAAFQGAKAVDTKDLALDLDSLAVRLRGEAQRAVQKVRDMLNVTGTPDALDPDPYTLFQTRRAIDGMLETEANSTVIGVLTDARKQVDDLLKGAVPGIKEADAKFAELARQNEALGRGQQLLDSGRTAMRPEELADELATASPGVQMRLSQGARAEIERIIGTTANDLNALKTALKGDGSWNRERLALLFGQDKADRLLQILERERTFALTNDVVTRNSETAARQAAQAEVDGGSPKMLRDLTLTGLVASGAQKLANVGARARRSGTNGQIAQALMSRQLDQGTTTAIKRAIEARLRNSAIAPAAVPLLLQ